MRKAAFLSLALALAPARAWSAEPVDTELPKRNVTWTTPSTGITESMPIGNGRVAALVWAEKGGDLMVSVATGDSWDENARSIRTGNVRFALSPNPFASGKPFQQVLDYKNAEIAPGRRQDAQPAQRLAQRLERAVQAVGSAENLGCRQGSGRQVHIPHGVAQGARARHLDQRRGSDRHGDG